MDGDPLDLLHRAGRLVPAGGGRGERALPAALHRPRLPHRRARAARRGGGGARAFVERCFVVAEEIHEGVSAPTSRPRPAAARGAGQPPGRARPGARARRPDTVAITLAVNQVVTWRDLREIWAWAIELADDPALAEHPDRADPGARRRGGTAGRRLRVGDPVPTRRSPRRPRRVTAPRWRVPGAPGPGGALPRRLRRAPGSGCAPRRWRSRARRARSRARPPSRRPTAATRRGPPAAGPRRRCGDGRLAVAARLRRLRRGGAAGADGPEAASRSTARPSSRPACGCRSWRASPGSRSPPPRPHRRRAGARPGSSAPARWRRTGHNPSCGPRPATRRSCSRRPGTSRRRPCC